MFAAGIIVVPVSIGSAAPLPFVLDTAAGRTLIHTDRAGPGTSGNTVNLPSAAGQITGTLRTVSSITIGSGTTTISCGSTSVFASSQAVIPSPPGVRAVGILGMDVLAHWCLEFDFVRSRITFRPTGARPELKWRGRRAPIYSCLLQPVTGGDIPAVIVDAGNSHFAALVDTGYGGLVLMPYVRAAAAGLVQQHYPRIVTSARTPAGTFKIAKARAGTLLVAGVDAGGRLVDIDERTDAGAPSFGFVGTSFLRYFRVALDQHAGRLSLQRNQLAEVPNSLTEPEFGLTVKAFHRWLLVTSVAQLSPAQQAGIHPGDRIIAIGRRNVSELAEAASTYLTTGAPTLFTVQPAVDPNLGTSRPVWEASIAPSAPIDWGRQ